MTKTVLTVPALSATPKSIFKAEPKPNVQHLPLLRLADVARDDILMYTLARAVTARRDHGSVTEAEFVAWLARWVGATMIDTQGNVHVDLRSDASHRTLFTSHTDSVHNGGGPNLVRVDEKFWRADGAALGADDASGVALMCHLINHGVPAYYIFFRGEECGGIGSSGLYEDDPNFFKAFDRAIAFDRANYSDVITHQGGTRCCSDAFASALSSALTPNDFSLAFMPCDSGVYTDTAEFTDTIPECTNVSVGYFRQHGEHEYQDIDFLQKLAQQLLTVDWDGLPTKRDPKTYEDLYSADWRPGAFGGRRYAVTPVVLSGLAQTTLAACRKWLDGNSAELMMVLAEWMSPDNPSVAMQQMRPNKMHELDVIDAIKCLEAGWEAEHILADLYQVVEVY